jgi:hypothetical protein
MTERVPPRRRGSYGIDAPYGPAFMAVVAAFEFTLAVLTGKAMPFLAGLFVLAFLGFYLHGTLRGKFVLWAGLLDSLNLRGMSASWTWDAAGGRFCSWLPSA